MKFIFFVFVALLYIPAIYAQDAETQLQNLAASIRHAEQQTSIIDNKLEKLKAEIDSIQKDIGDTSYQAAQQLHIYHTVKRSSHRLSFLLPDISFLDYYQKLRRHENRKNILIKYLSDYHEKLIERDNKIALINKYIHDKNALSLSVKSLLNRIRSSNQWPLPDSLIQKKIEILQAQYNNLNNFISSLINMPILIYKPTSQPVFTLPVSGIIDSQKDGITILASKNSLVSTPAAGRVLFSGHFKNLNKLVIIDHGGGYLSILRGLKDVFVESGFILNTDEPIGIIGGDGWDKDTNNAILYYELRYNNKLINPINKITGL